MLADRSGTVPASWTTGGDGSALLAVPSDLRAEISGREIRLFPGELELLEPPGSKSGLGRSAQSPQLEERNLYAVCAFVAVAWFAVVVATTKQECRLAGGAHRGSRVTAIVTAMTRRSRTQG